MSNTSTSLVEKEHVQYLSPFDMLRPISILRGMGQRNAPMRQLRRREVLVNAGRRGDVEGVGVVVDAEGHRRGEVLGLVVADIVEQVQLSVAESTLHLA